MHIKLLRSASPGRSVTKPESNLYLTVSGYRRLLLGTPSPSSASLFAFPKLQSGNKIKYLIISNRMNLLLIHFKLLVSRFRSQGLFSIMLVLALMLSVSGCSDSHQPQQAASPLLKVNAVKAETVKVPLYAEAIGNTRAVETVEIRSRVDGYLLGREFEDGSRVKQGQLLFIIDPDQYEQDLKKQKVQLEYARANLELARKESKRYETLLSKQLVSMEEYELRQLREKEAEAQLEVSQTNVNLAKIRINHTRISSPVDGIIGLSQVDRGGLVNAGSTLMAVISTVDPMYFYFSMSEEDYLNFIEHFGDEFHHIMKTMSLSLTLTGGLEYPHKGHLDMIDRTVDPGTGSISARAIVPNPEGALRPGMFARARFTILEESEGLFIPQQAVMDMLGRKSVFAVDEDGIVSSRNVTLGARVNDMRIVLDGISPGEMIAVSHLLRLRPGMQIEPVLNSGQQ